MDILSIEMNLLKKTFGHKIHPKENSTKKSEKKNHQHVVHLHQLFRFANLMDWILIIIGMIGSIGHGASSPLLWLLFGYITDSFTEKNSLLCSMDFQSFNRTYSCPTNLRLTQENFVEHYKKCHLNKSNVTMLEKIINSSDIQFYSISIAALGLIAFVCAYLQTTFWTISAERQTRRIRDQTFQSILHQKEMSFFDHNSPGELTELISQGICKVNDGIGDKFGSSLQYLSSFLAGLIIGFIQGWKLTLVILSMSPLLALSGILYSKIAARMASKEQQSYAQAGRLAEQCLTAIKTVLAFQASDYELKRYEDELKMTRKNGVKQGAMFGFVTGFDYLVVFCADALGFWFGARLIRTDGYSIGQTLLVFFSVINAMFALGRSAPYIQAVINAKGNAFSIWKIIDTTRKVEDTSSSKGLRPAQIDGNIAFVNVSFSYPSRSTSPILRNVSFNISAGQTVAIVGSTGSGKSTCLELLERFYQPSQGFLSLDDQRLNLYDLHWLRRQISVVNQQPVLFQATVMENIRMGNRQATDADIIELCRNMEIDEMIRQLSKKEYHTEISPNGSNLSGGQRQKIALARALIRNPRILLLDEATAALDYQSERQIHKAIERASLNRTTIIIAHRLSTIRRADQIIVLDQGKIFEIGTHESLIDRRGKYYELLQGQILENNFDEALPEKDVHLESVVAHINEEQTTNDDDEKKKRRKFSFRRLLSLNRPEWIYIFVACLLSIISGAIEPAFALILSQLVSVLEECQLSKHTRDLNLLIILFVICGIVMFITMFLQSFLLAKSGEGLTYRLRVRAYRTILEQNLSWFDQAENCSGILCTRLATETSAVHQATGVLLGLSLRSFSNLFIGIILGFYASWRLTLLMCAFLPFLILSGWLQTKVSSRFIQLETISIEKSSNIVAQVTQNIRTVFQLTEERTFLDEYNEILDQSYRKLLRRAHWNGLLFAFANSISYFAQSALFTFGAYLVSKEHILFEDIILIFSVVMFGAVSVAQSFSMCPNYAKAQSATEKLFELFDLESNRCEIYSSEKEIEDLKSIEFDNVTFAYPNRPDRLVLENLSMKIQAGEHIALIGASGSGKSTIIQLIQRFYHRLDGKIRLNSKDIEQINLDQLRSQIALVSQEADLFDRSIADNIKYGDVTRQVSDEEMFLAAQRAHIHDFILALPDGYSTMIGSHAVQLSGGQRQRLAIARALIRPFQLLLLDEPTSALDSISEEIVQQALDELKHRCTSITVAHRLSTVKKCDVIYVIHQGSILEYGNHQELIDQKGYYCRLLQISQR